MGTQGKVSSGRACGGGWKQESELGLRNDPLSSSLPPPQQETVLRTRCGRGLWGGLARKEPFEEGFKISPGTMCGPWGELRQRFLWGCSGAGSLTQTRSCHQGRREKRGGADLDPPSRALAASALPAHPLGVWCGVDPEPPCAQVLPCFPGRCLLCQAGCVGGRPGF